MEGVGRNILLSREVTVGCDVDMRYIRKSHRKGHLQRGIRLDISKGYEPCQGGGR